MNRQKRWAVYVFFFLLLVIPFLLGAIPEKNASDEFLAEVYLSYGEQITLSFNDPEDSIIAIYREDGPLDGVGIQARGRLLSGFYGGCEYTTALRAASGWTEAMPIPDNGQWSDWVSIQGWNDPEGLIRMSARATFSCSNTGEVEYEIHMGDPQDEPSGPTPTWTNTPYSPPPPVEPPPDGASFQAGESLFCRAGPDTSYEDYWWMDDGQISPALARWNNGWILVGINDSRTRTKCCWVNGYYGTLSVPTDQIPVIDYLPDRLSCDLPFDIPEPPSSPPVATTVTPTRTPTRTPTHTPTRTPTFTPTPVDPPPEPPTPPDPPPAPELPDKKFQTRLEVKLLVVTNSLALNYFTQNDSTWQDVHGWLDQRYGQDGYDLIDLADSYGGNSPKYNVVEAVIETQWSQARYWAVFIIGGHSVVPFGQLINLVPGDNDILWTDDMYGDGNDDSVPDVPVARLPDGGSYDLLYNQFHTSGSGRNTNFAMVNAYHRYVERFAGNFNSLYYVPAFNRNSNVPQGVDSGFVYFDLINHSDPSNSHFNRTWWGWDPFTNSYSPAFLNTDANTSGVVLAGTSYGGLVWGCTAPGCPNTQGFIPLEFLKNGSRAYIGSTVYNYSFPTLNCEGGICSNSKDYSTMTAGIPVFAQHFLQANGVNSPLSAFFIGKVRMLSATSDPAVAIIKKMGHGLVYYGVPDPDTDCIDCAQEFFPDCPSGDPTDCDGDKMLDVDELWLVNNFKPYLIYHIDDIDFKDGVPPPMYWQVTPGYYAGEKGAWLTMVIAYQWDGGAPRFDSGGPACRVYGCLVGAAAGSVLFPVGGTALGCGVGAVGIEDFVETTGLGAVVAMHKGDTEGLRFFLAEGPQGWYVSHIDWKRHFHEKFGDPQPVGEIGGSTSWLGGSTGWEGLEWQADPETGKPTHPVLYVALDKHAVYPFPRDCNEEKFHIISEGFKQLPGALDCEARTEICASFQDGNAFGIFLETENNDRNVGERDGLVLDTHGGLIKLGYRYHWHDEMNEYPGNFAWSYDPFCGGMTDEKVSGFQAHACGGGLANKWWPSNP